MTRRHLRAMAVFAVVLVTLTGARRSHGGGCDDHDSSSGSGSSGGYSSGGYSSGGHDDIDPPGTSGSTTSGGDRSRPESTPNAMRDVRLTSCDYDRDSKEFTSDVTVANTDATGNYDYTILIRVERTEGGASTGELLSSDSVHLENVGAGQTRQVTSRSFRPMHKAATFRCTVSRASKYPAS